MGESNEIKDYIRSGSRQLPDFSQSSAHQVRITAHLMRTWSDVGSLLLPIKPLPVLVYNESMEKLIIVILFIKNIISKADNGAGDHDSEEYLNECIAF